jgi:hypothetical protein
MKTKQNKSLADKEPEQLPPSLARLKHEVNGFKIPEGYFDTLSPRIADSIKSQKRRSFFQALFPSFRKPFVWAPVMATAIVAALLVFVIPEQQESSIPVIDEWTEINMAYDASYAEEALLAESNAIDTELEITEMNNNESIPATEMNEYTADEITEYLKNQEIDSEILIAN